MLNNVLVKLPNISLKTSFLVFIALVATAALSVIATPKFKALTKPPVLEDVVPLQLGEWTNKPSPFAQVSVNTYAQNLSDFIYDQVLMRTYEDKAGDQVMVALAFASEQRQEIKIHQPEVCYPAQGYEMLGIQNHTFNLPSYPQPITGKRLIFKKDNRIEAVSYWIRLGNSFPMNGFEMRLKILKEGLKGNLDDGILVRVSSIIDQESDAAAAYQIHDRFLSSLVSIVSNTEPNLLVHY